MKTKKKTHSDIVDECLLDLALAVDNLFFALEHDFLQIKQKESIYQKVGEKLLGKKKQK